MSSQETQKAGEAAPPVPKAAMSSPQPVKPERGQDSDPQEVPWPDDTKETQNNGKDSDGHLPAEICVVIGGSRNSQTLGSYVCGICGKKYKYYNCFQTHVRAHRALSAETETGSGEGGSQGLNSNFRYACDICGKKYKYYSCFQEHRDLHAVDDPYDQNVIPVDDLKEEEQAEPFQKIGPKFVFVFLLFTETGNYVCEFCGKQYKYFNPYQEHVALHAPISRPLRGIHITVVEGNKNCQDQRAEMSFCFIKNNVFLAAILQRLQPSVTCQKTSVSCNFFGTQELLAGQSWSLEMRAPRSQQHPAGSVKLGTPKTEHNQIESAFCRKMEGKLQNNVEETNSSHNSSGGTSPVVSSPFPLLQKPYTCGACGIQFQFYNNLLEHMQSHAADNENRIKVEQPKSSPAPAAQEKLWKPPAQRNHTTNFHCACALSRSVEQRRAVRTHSERERPVRLFASCKFAAVTGLHPNTTLHLTILPFLLWEDGLCLGRRKMDHIEEPGTASETPKKGSKSKGTTSDKPGTQSTPARIPVVKSGKRGLKSQPCAKLSRESKKDYRNTVKPSKISHHEHASGSSEMPASGLAITHHTAENVQMKDVEIEAAASCSNSLVYASYTDGYESAEPIKSGE
ncbi:ZN618 protein, partial [Atractosteus spatula]|nr:ZN618 protein [Atractosteus spatula]